MSRRDRSAARAIVQRVTYLRAFLFGAHGSPARRIFDRWLVTSR